MKLRWSKSSRLLQRIVFLVISCVGVVGCAGNNDEIMIIVITKVVRIMKIVVILRPKLKTNCLKLAMW